VELVEGPNSDRRYQFHRVCWYLIVSQRAAARLWSQLMIQASWELPYEESAKEKGRK